LVTERKRLFNVGSLPISEEMKMRLVAKRLSVMAGLVAVAVSAVAGSALAHDDDYGWKKYKHHHKHRFVPPGHVYYYSAPPYYYSAPPVVYAPRPLIYDGPRYYAPRYYGAPAPSLNINVPLR
jgi:hypothetical protein